MNAPIFAKLRTAIERAVVDTVSKSSVTSATTRECFQNITESLALTIDRSKIFVTGDFIVSQQARAALACVQSSEIDAALRQEIESNVVQSVDAVFADQKIPVSSETVRERVAKILPNALTKCTASQRQGVVVAPTLDIFGSTLKVGCLEDKLKRKGAECLALLEQGAGEDNEPCKYIANCLAKEGNLEIITDFDVSESCGDLVRLTMALTADALGAQATSVDKNNTQRPPKPTDAQEKETTALSTGTMVAIGAAVLLFVLFVVALIASRSRASAQESPSLPQSFASEYDLTQRYPQSYQTFQ